MFFSMKDNLGDWTSEEVNTVYYELQISLKCIKIFACPCLSNDVLS